MDTLKLKSEARATLKGKAAVTSTGKIVASEYSQGDGSESPLALIAESLASCEAIMFGMIAEKINASQYEVTVEAELVFRAGYGLEEGHVTYRVKGLSEQLAKRIIDIVEKNCPVYLTLSRTGAVMKSSLIILIISPGIRIIPGALRGENTGFKRRPWKH